MPNRQETLYKDFSWRLLTRMAWNSSRRGTLWLHRERPKKVKHRPTEAEDNALGRTIRRRANRRARQAGKPHAAR